MNNLNSVQIAKVKEILNNARTMKDDDLEALRNRMSASDGNLELRDLILEGINSIMNKDQLTNIALVPEHDLRHGELS